MVNKPAGEEHMMGSIEIIMPYTAEVAQWIHAQAGIYLPVQSSNTLGTLDDLLWAVGQVPYPSIITTERIEVHGDPYYVYFTIPPVYDHLISEGTCCLLLEIVTRLSSRCGQLCVIDGGGGPVILLDAHSDPAVLNAAWQHAMTLSADEMWPSFYQTAYGSAPA
jgi:hypothetical protein